MKLLDPGKWERIRARGRRRFIFAIALPCFGVGVVITLLSLWSMRRLQLELSWPTSALQPFLWWAVLFAFLAFPLTGVVCGWLAWFINERLYRHHREVSP